MNLKITQASDRVEVVNSQVIDKLYRFAYEDQSIGVASQITSGENDIVGYIRSAAAYQDAVEYLRAKFPNLTIDIPNNNYYIRFEDPAVEQLCMQYISSDHNGVSLADAYNITSFNLNDNSFSIFQGNTQITKFNELKYFTRLAQIERIFEGCTNLQEVTMAPGLEYIWYNINSPFYDCINLTTINWNGSTLSTISPNTSVRLLETYGGKRYEKLRWYDGLIPTQQKYPANMFNACRVLEKVIFPEGTTSVAELYSGCEGLQYIEYPSTLLEVGSFMNTLRDGYTGGARIIFKSTTPPTLRADNGNYTGLQYARPFTIYVPNGSILDYKNAPYPWTEVVDRIQPIGNLPDLFISMGTLTQSDKNAPYQEGYNSPNS